MKIILNELDSNNVSTEDFQGREHLVAPVVAMRAMNLDGGYVPKREVERSAPAWNGIPVTLNHPQQNGDLVSANIPDVAEKTWLGYFFNAETDDDKLAGEVWIDVENAEDVGGEAQEIVDALNAGESVSVSTSYFGDRLPSGEYDGKTREQVVGNIRPDHLAVLPNQDGMCSIDDGCMAGIAANAIQVAAEADDPVDPGEEPGEPMADDPDLDLANADDATIGARIKQALFGASNGDESAESDETTDNMEDKTKELVENHGFDEENLPDEDTECFGRIYERFNEEEETSEEETTTDEETTDEEPTDEETSEEPALDEDRIAEIAAEAAVEAVNQKSVAERRAELVGDILENSDDWSEDELEDTPVDVLVKIANDTAPEPQANYVAQRGASADSESSNNFPSLSVTGRVSESDD